METINKNIAFLSRFLRGDHTLEEIASTTNLSRATISKIETENKTVSLTSLFSFFLIFEISNCQVCSLLEGEELSKSLGVEEDDFYHHIALKRNLFAQTHFYFDEIDISYLKPALEEKSFNLTKDCVGYVVSKNNQTILIINPYGYKKNTVLIHNSLIKEVPKEIKTVSEEIIPYHRIDCSCESLKMIVDKIICL